MQNKTSNILLIGIVVIIALLLLLVYCHNRYHMPKVSFANLSDGAQVESPFVVEMKAEHLIVEPAANGVSRRHGHFHIIIDSPLPPVGEPVPMDSLHLHYGKGQTEATLNLPEGDHTLTLQFANGNHFPYDPQVIQTIHIHVTKQNVPATVTDSTKMSTVTKTKTIVTMHHSMDMQNEKITAKPDTIHKAATTQPIPTIGVGMGGGGAAVTP